MLNIGHPVSEKKYWKILEIVEFCSIIVQYHWINMTKNMQTWTVKLRILIIIWYIFMKNFDKKNRIQILIIVGEFYNTRINWTAIADMWLFNFLLIKHDIKMYFHDKKKKNYMW